ncbi:MAG: hypothetical protein Q8L71_10085 [Thiobacillus sp.]|nr:hypothetical protein [Thiobacillus sp.]
MGKGKAARLGLLAAAVVTALPALAADDADTNRQLQRLMERVEQLEKRNAELEQALQPRATGANSQIEARLKALEERNTRLDSALSTEDVSEKEPELAARLKAVEYQALDIQKQAKVIDSIEGFSAGANFTTVAQRASGIDNNGTQLNYRADIMVTRQPS